VNPSTGQLAAIVSAAVWGQLGCPDASGPADGAFGLQAGVPAATATSAQRVTAIRATRDRSAVELIASGG
jgi:hypothetical protein